MADDTNNQNPAPVAPISVPVAAPVTNQNLDNSGSRFYRLSVRAFIALILTLTTCIAVLVKITIPEYFITLVSMAISFYFGHSVGQSSNTSNK